MTPFKNAHGGLISAHQPFRSAVKRWRRTHNTLAERWYADVRQHVVDGTKSPNTARLYRHYLDRHILAGIGALRLSEATVPQLDIADRGADVARCGRSSEVEGSGSDAFAGGYPSRCIGPPVASD